MFYACNLPTISEAPYKVATTVSSITLGWNEPANDGGCPITGFAVFRDDGAGGNVTTEVNQANDPLIRGIPTLR